VATSHFPIKLNKQGLLAGPSLLLLRHERLSTNIWELVDGEDRPLRTVVASLDQDRMIEKNARTIDYPQLFNDRHLLVQHGDKLEITQGIVELLLVADPTLSQGKRVT
jgi:hypothetical protein